MAIAAAVVVWATSRLRRRMPAYLAWLPVLLAVLFMFFEQVTRLLPANF